MKDETVVSSIEYLVLRQNRFYSLLNTHYSYLFIKARNAISKAIENVRKKHRDSYI